MQGLAQGAMWFGLVLGFTNVVLEQLVEVVEPGEDAARVDEVACTATGDASGE